VNFVQSLPRDMSARRVAEQILESLREFLGPVEPQDDMTLLVLRALEPVTAEVRATSPHHAVTAI
jgi:serine phosphatase RsbU (regulator of sigma subunit)